VQENFQLRYDEGDRTSLRAQSMIAVGALRLVQHGVSSWGPARLLGFAPAMEAAAVSSTQKGEVCNQEESRLPGETAMAAKGASRSDACFAIGVEHPEWTV
jgi:hypothetical protein